jgi:hypothetical protein
MERGGKLETCKADRFLVFDYPPFSAAAAIDPVRLHRELLFFPSCDGFVSLHVRFFFPVGHAEKAHLQMGWNWGRRVLVTDASPFTKKMGDVWLVSERRVGV